MNYIKKLSILSMCVLLTSCFSNEYELIGEKKVEGSRNLYVKIYQEDKFDYVTPIHFELLNIKDSVIIPETYLTGTDVRYENIERFFPFLYDSIFYICYPYPKVYFIQHLNTIKPQFPRDSLFKKLKERDNKLIDKEK